MFVVRLSLLMIYCLSGMPSSIIIRVDVKNIAFAPDALDPKQSARLLPNPVDEGIHLFCAHIRHVVRTRLPLGPDQELQLLFDTNCSL